MFRAGVPQASLTGFVDDTNLAVTAPTIQQLQVEAQATVDRVEQHMTASRFKVNTTKTHLLLVARPSLQQQGIVIRTPTKIIQN